MKVKEIPFVGRSIPTEAQDISHMPGGSWSAPIKFPLPVRFNNQLCTTFNLSKYGAIRLSSGKDGTYHYLPGDRSLPASIDQTKDGWMIVPWGDNIRMAGCGITVLMWRDADKVVIDYTVKNQLDPHIKYMFRVEFPTKQPNTVEIHYYHVVSGYNTYVGVVMAPDNFCEWTLKETQPYSKKALRFTCDNGYEMPEQTETPGNTPFGNVPTDIPEPLESPEPIYGPKPGLTPTVIPDKPEWRVVYEGHGCQVRELVK